MNRNLCYNRRGEKINHSLHLNDYAGILLYSGCCSHICN